MIWYSAFSHTSRKEKAPRLLTAIAFAILAATVVQGCSDKSSPSEPPSAGSIALDPKSATLAVGGKVQLSATIHDASGSVVTGRTVSWTSGNSAVATVDANGLVTGVATGSADVIAASGGLSDHAAITVTTIPRVYQSLTAGGLNTCRLTESGLAYCWGNNSTVPVAVSGGVTFSTLTAGNFTICGITKTEAPYCWGENGSSVPVAAPGGHEFIAVTIGDGFGPGHYCGLTDSGTAYCWGNNYYGQVGDGTTSGDADVNGWPVRTAPVAVAGAISFAAITAGLFHTCGLTLSGAAYCWGYNSSGQLGSGSSTQSSSVPVAVTGGLTFVTLSAGGSETCGLTSGGAAYCWGANGAGSLGNGSTTSSSVPVAVAGGISFSSITPGSGHACGLTANGTAYCWGWNELGQLGIGNYGGSDQCVSQLGGACSAKPVPVTGGVKFAALSAGGQTSCGVTLSGNTYCWGDNRYGQLGNGTKTNVNEPVEVVGFGAPPSVASVAMSLHAAAIVPGGTVQLAATTRDANGSLLLGRSVSWSSANPTVAIVDPNGLVSGVATGSAMVIATSEGRSDTASISVATVAFFSVSAGRSSTCGLTSTRSTYCWGDSSGGPIAVEAGWIFTRLTIGQSYTCALNASGAAYCWGSNTYGQLGNGSTINSATPVAVSGSLTFTGLAAGAAHTCGVTTSGSAYCWGTNATGELGDGSTSLSTTPVAVAGGMSFVALDVGAGHSCGLTNGGAMFCWGRNAEGQLGLGTATGPQTCTDQVIACSTVPVQVTGGILFSEVTTGGWHTCALSTAGAAYCWGLNDDGQLGTGSTTSTSAPTLVSGNLTFSAFATGNSRGDTCALTTSGAAYCWGANAAGQLGNGSTASSSIPVAVSGGLSFSAVVMGGFLGGTQLGHSCGITSTGQVYCWGDNSAGQLGDGTTTNRSTPVKVVGQQ